MGITTLFLCIVECRIVKYFINLPESNLFLFENTKQIYFM